MDNDSNLISRLEGVSKIIGLDNFYSISICTLSGQMSLQGGFTDITTSFAKSIGIQLIYDEDSSMLLGVSSDGRLRIVLT